MRREQIRVYRDVLYINNPKISSFGGINTKICLRRLCVHVLWLLNLYKMNTGIHITE